MVPLFAGIFVGITMLFLIGKGGDSKFLKEGQNIEKKKILQAKQDQKEAYEKLSKQDKEELEKETKQKQIKARERQAQLMSNLSPTEQQLLGDFMKDCSKTVNKAIETGEVQDNSAFDGCMIIFAMMIFVGIMVIQFQLGGIQPYIQMADDFFRMNQRKIIDNEHDFTQDL